MRTAPFFALAILLSLSGCSALGLFGSKALTMEEVTGRYRFAEVTVDPTSEALRDKKLTDDVITEDITLLLLADGSARLEQLRGDRVDATLSGGTFSIRGREVAIRFQDEEAVARLSLPMDMTLRGGSGKLEGDIFREGINLEAVSSDYRGITQADVTLKVRMSLIE